MKAVTFNPLAITDLEEIISTISQDNPDAAANIRSAIFETAQSLGAHPGLGTPTFQFHSSYRHSLHPRERLSQLSGVLS